MAAASLQAQIVDTTVCDVLSNPQSFDGKIVRIKGTVIAGFDEFAIKDSSCKQAVNGIWLSYPEGTKAKSGPAALLQLQLAKNSPGTVSAASRVPVTLDKNKDFKQLDSLLSTAYKGPGMCLGCAKYTVSGVLVGRLDGLKSVNLTRDANGKFVSADGFGNMNRYAARLVLQSVSEVKGEEIDYSKAASVTKGDFVREGAAGDPVKAAHQAAKAFGPASPAAERVEQAAAAYGKPGEDNGVVVSFGVPNEVSKGEGVKGQGDSPDGLLLTCTFDMDRLKGDALSKAIVHLGTHVADLRGDQTSSSAVRAESRAWQTTVLAAAATGQKTMTLPGGYVIWNASWAASEKSKLIDEAISAFASGWLPFAD